MTTKADVVSWILTSADKQDLDDIFSVGNERNRTLHRLVEAKNNATLQKGSRVVLTDLKPKYLNDRKGTLITSPRRATGKKVSIVCDIELDNPIYQGNRYGDKIVRGVPTACVKVIGA